MTKPSESSSLRVNKAALVFLLCVLPQFEVVALDEEEQSFHNERWTSYGYGQFSIAPSLDAGTVQLGAGSLYHLGQFNEGFDFGVVVAWDSAAPDESLFGFSARSYVATDTTISLMASIGLLLVTEFWSTPTESDIDEAAGSDKIVGLIGVVPELGIVVPGFASVQAQFSCRPLLALSSAEGVLFRLEFGVGLRIGRVRHP
jgi:hypothetical protein